MFIRGAKSRIHVKFTLKDWNDFNEVINFIKASPDLGIIDQTSSEDYSVVCILHYNQFLHILGRWDLRTELYLS